MVDKKDLKKDISNAMLNACDKVFDRLADNPETADLSDEEFADFFNGALKEICEDWAKNPLTY